MKAKHVLAAFLLSTSALTFSPVVFGFDNMPADMAAQIRADEARQAKWESTIIEQRKMDDRHFQEQRSMEDRHYQERKTLRDKQMQERDAMFDKMYPMDDGMVKKAPPKK
jgi:hypothetical protein